MFGGGRETPYKTLNLSTIESSLISRILDPKVMSSSQQESDTMSTTKSNTFHYNIPEQPLLSFDNDTQLCYYVVRPPVRGIFKLPRLK